MCTRRGFFMIVTRAMQTVTSYEFQVEVKDGEIIVALPSSGFMAVYFKRSGSPFLTLRQRTKTDDHELLAQVFRTAVNKARELGWIV
jgi:hypothetical protein